MFSFVLASPSVPGDANWVSSHLPLLWEGTNPGQGSWNLQLQGGGNLQLLDNTTYQYEFRISAIDTVSPTDAAWWWIVGGAFRREGTSSAIGPNFAVTQSAGTSADDWDVEVSVDSDTNQLIIETIVPSSNPVRFVVSGFITTSSVSV
jgi:hypothetical protein